jgi:L-ascorbate metabolism protein UlaG (beta-lactamase superfamily)
LPRKRSGPGLRFALNLIAKSALQPMQGSSQKPLLAKPEELAVTFIGHASFLIQIGGLRILIDPVFADWLVLIRRQRRPGVLLPDLPPIDAVLLTHAHMDHLNLPSLRQVIRHTFRMSGRTPVAIVPEGVQDLVNKLGFESVQTLRWWSSLRLRHVEVTMTPSQHWGARMLRDTHRGFGGYNLRNGAHSVYHSGDSGYFPGFREIGDRMQPKVALLPIGAYRPDGFRRVHTSPEDALKAFGDLQAESMVPMHYGTFRLSEEPMDEPLARLMTAAAGAGIQKRIHPLREGDTTIFP